MIRSILRIACLFPVLLVLPGPLPAQPKSDPATQFINDYFAKQWQTQKLTPAEKCTDEEFIRRASLDIIGRAATADEVRAFVKETAADRRTKLIDRLLASPEYAHHWGGLWTNWLVPRGSLPAAQRQQLYFTLTKEFASPKMNHKDLVVKILTASGSSGSNGAVLYIAAHRGLAIPPDKDEGAFDMVPLTSRSLRLFLGYRLVAYQLPDHPVHPDFKPEQFWGVAAFFRQTEVSDSGEVKENPALNKKGTVSFPDKDGKPQSAGTAFLDGRKLPADGKQTRRQVLAAMLTSHDNFAKAYVNRVWGHLFGRGLHERPAVDDFSSQHKVVHPELLDRLAKDFAAGHDPKPLIRAICASEPYQRKSVANPTNAREDIEVYFSRMPLKIITPEQLLESLLASIKGDDAGVRKLRAAGQEHIAKRVGDSEWDDLPTQERIILNVVALNRKEINDAMLTAKTGPVARGVALKETDKILDELYLSALNRRPTTRESTHLKELMDKEAKIGKDLGNFWQDLYWALLNSSEFILNH